MKVLINHKQHLLLIEENQRWDKFIQYFTTSTVNKNVDEWLNDFFK